VGLSDATLVVGMAVALRIVGLIVGLSDSKMVVGMAVGLIVGLSDAKMVVGMAVALPSVGLIEGLAEVGERLSTHSSASVSHWQWSTLLHRFLFDCSEH